jgi:hypothetical protein
LNGIEKSVQRLNRNHRWIEQNVQFAEWRSLAHAPGGQASGLPPWKISRLIKDPSLAPGLHNLFLKEHELVGICDLFEYPPPAGCQRAAE